MSYLPRPNCWSGSGIKPSTDIPHFQECNITISINGTRYPSKIDNQLRYHINGSYFKRYMQHQYKWNEKVWLMIDTTSFGRFFAQLSTTKQVQQHMEFIYNLQSIGKHKLRMSAPHPTSTHGQCPCCLTKQETQQHLLICKMNQQCKKALARFHNAGTASNGNRFNQIFTDLVGQWLTDPTVS